MGDGILLVVLFLPQMYFSDPSYLRMYSAITPQHTALCLVSHQWQVCNEGR